MITRRNTEGVTLDDYLRLMTLLFMIYLERNLLIFRENPYIYVSSLEHYHPWNRQVCNSAQTYPSVKYVCNVGEWRTGLVGLTFDHKTDVILAREV